jgi:hypothetical protein
MRTKQLIMGLNNSQKFRAVINGVMIGDLQVKDLNGNRFPQRDQRLAVWLALEELARSRRVSNTLIEGFGRNYDGIDIQVNLI